MKKITLDRRASTAELIKHRGDALIVAGLGAPCWDIAAAADDPLNFYAWGGMGGASMIGLGLALAQPRRRVLVITGDGEMLMGLGALATIAAQHPRNLAILVQDNERYGETGMQLTHTALGVDLAGMARAAGFRAAGTIRTGAQFKAWMPKLYRQPGPVFAVIKVAADRAPMILPPRDGTVLKNRFREALLGPAALK